jgi:hypothetical protein
MRSLSAWRSASPSPDASNARRCAGLHATPSRRPPRSPTSEPQLMELDHVDRQDALVIAGRRREPRAASKPTEPPDRHYLGAPCRQRPVQAAQWRRCPASPCLPEFVACPAGGEGVSGSVCEAAGHVACASCRRPTFWSSCATTATRTTDGTPPRPPCAEPRPRRERTGRRRRRTREMNAQ